MKKYKFRFFDWWQDQHPLVASVAFALACLTGFMLVAIVHDEIAHRLFD